MKSVTTPRVARAHRLTLLIAHAAAVAIGPSTGRQAPAIKLVAPAWIRTTRTNDRLVVETASRAYTTPAGAKLTVRGIVHVAEEAYWRDAKTLEGRVLFESIVDASLLDERGALTTSIAATNEARNAAVSCALVPQLDALGGTARDRDWRVADLSRAELGGVGTEPAASELRYLARDVPENEPLYLSFGAVAGRLLCALAPAPELAVAALDWRGGGKSVPTDAAGRAIAAGMLRLDTAALARLGLARALLAEAPPRAPDDVLIGRRNARCVEAITATAGDAHVLYGVAHLRDLDGRLRKAGYARQRGEEWLRAFAVPLAGEGAALAVLAPALLVLLGIDAADYVATLADAASGGAAAALGLYAVRHAALYYALRKWLLS